MPALATRPEHEASGGLQDEALSARPIFDFEQPEIRLDHVRRKSAQLRNPAPPGPCCTRRRSLPSVVYRRLAAENWRSDAHS
jgi:hypothetical protein